MPPIAATRNGAPLRSGRLALSEACEPLIRIFAWFAFVMGRQRTSIEMRIRGAILGGFANGWRIGRGVEFSGMPGRFWLGSNVVIYGNTYLDANGENGRIEIGPDSHIDRFCVLYGQGGLSIGSNCAVASSVIIYSQTNQDQKGDGSPVTLQPTRYAPVTVEDGVWLGARVCILPGVVIGAGTTVGAGAVVLRSLPAHVTAYGVPARIASTNATTQGPGLP